MVLRCPKRSEKTPENVQIGSKKRPKYGPKLMSKLAPKWLQKWFQNGSKNGPKMGPKTTSKTTSKKTPKKSYFINLSLQGPGSAWTRTTCIHVQAALVPACPLWSQLKRIRSSFWHHFGTILARGGSFWDHLECPFGVILGSWALELVLVILGALFVLFRGPIWVPFWAHFSVIFKLENQSDFCTPPGSHFGVILGVILVPISD